MVFVLKISNLQVDGLDLATDMFPVDSNNDGGDTSVFSSDLTNILVDPNADAGLSSDDGLLFDDGLISDDPSLFVSGNGENVYQNSVASAKCDSMSKRDILEGDGILGKYGWTDT